MLTIEQARESFFEYLKLGNDILDKIRVTSNANDKLILSWALYFCSGMSAKLTEAFLLENASRPDPSVRLQTNTKLNELHNLSAWQMQDDGSAWN